MPQMDFPGGPVAKTPNVGGQGLISGQGTRSHVQKLRRSAAKQIKKKCLINPLTYVVNNRGSACIEKHGGKEL